MKNKTLDNIHCFVTVALCAVIVLLNVMLYNKELQVEQQVEQYKQIASDAIKVAEECLRMKK